MAQKKILIFSLAYYPRFIGGDAVAVKEITDRISPSEFEFHLVTLRFDSMLPRQEKIGNVFVYRIGFALPNPSSVDLKRFPLHLTKAIYQISAALKGMSLHRKYYFDALWAVMAHSAGVPAALFKLFYPRIPYILTLQEGDPPEYIEHVMRPFWPLFTRAFTKADAMQTISTFLAKWARRRGFNGPLEVVPNGVDIRNFKSPLPSARHTAEPRLWRGVLAGPRQRRWFQISPGPPRTAGQANFKKLELRKKLGIQKDDKVLITTSRLVYKNGLDNVLRALPLLPQNIHFLILGIGPDEKKLKSLAEAIGVENRVKFLGQVNHSDMPEYLRIADIFIRPSRSEGMGNSFIEAMASGVPIIGTMVGGITDFLKNRETGFVCGVEDPQSIADQISFILEPRNKKIVDNVIKNAQKLAEEKYDWSTIAKSMRGLFEKITR